MSEFFRVTPPGLLTDDDAGFLGENWAAVPDTEKPFYAAKLNEYQNFREHYPRPLTPSEVESRQVERARVSEIFTDFDKATQGDNLGTMQFADAEETPALKQGLANRAFVQHMTGIDGDRLERDYELAREALAKKMFGGTGAKDDGEFHGQVKNWLTKENDKERVQKSLVEAGRKAAAWEGSGLDESVRPTLKSWQTEISGPGYGPDFTGEYERTFKAAQSEARAEFDRLRPYVDAAWFTLSGGPQDNGEPKAVDFEALADRLMEIPQEDRRKVLAMVKTRASLLPEAKQAGFFEKARKTFSRAHEAIGQGDVNELPRILPGIGTLGGDARERQGLYEDIRNLQRLDIDPVRGRNVVEDAALMVIGSLPGLAAMLTISPWAMVGQYASDARQTIRTELEAKGVPPEHSSEFANGLAIPAGIAMAYLEKLTLGMANSVPGVKQLQAKLLTGLSQSATRKALGYAGAFALETVEQNVQEALQDSAPMFLTEIAQSMGAPVPEIEAWAPGLETLKSPAAWATSAVFAGVGFGRMPEIEAAQILRERGATDEQIQAVLAAPDDAAYRQAVLDAVGAPKGEATTPDPTTVDAGAAVDQADAGVASVTRDAQGWWVAHNDGRRTQVDSAAAAQMLVQDLQQVNTQDEADAMVSLADDWAQRQPKAKQTFTGEQVTAGADGVFASRLGGAPRLVEMDPKSAEALAEELELLGRAEGGSAPITALVNGSNSVEWRRKISDDTQVIVDALNTKQNVGGTVLTQLHERVEATFRAGLETGQITTAEAFRAIRRLEQAMGRPVLSDDPSETELREAVSEMVVADTLGRRKDGARTPAGAVTKGMRAAIEAAADPAERAALGKFRSFLRAMRAHFRAIFKMAAAIGKARREGKIKEGDEYSTFVNKVLGLDAQVEHEEAVAREAGATVESSDAFSLRKKPLDDSDFQAYFDFNAVPAEKAKKGKAALKAAAVGVSAEPGGAERAAVERQRAKAERAWRGLVNAGGTAADRAAALAALEQGPVSSILHEFVSREIPVFQVRGAKVNTAADFWQLALAVRSPFFESIKVAVLDQDNTVIGSQIVLVGTLDESYAPFGQIIAAVDGIVAGSPGSKPKGWIISHNHPSGNPRPSQADIDMTNRLVPATQIAKLPLLDHVVTNGETYFSFAENGMVSPPSDIALARSPNTPGKIADWETVERSKLTNISSPADIHRVSNVIKTADPDHAHIIYVGTKHQVMAVERVEMSEAVSQILRGAGREGSKKAFIVLPTGADAQALQPWIYQVANEIRRFGMQVLDIAAFNPDYSKFVSAREKGLFEADGEYSGETFSLSSATGLERLANQIANRPSTPIEKARIFNRMAADLAGMARAVEFNDTLSKPTSEKEQLRALVALDAMLMNLPAEVRGKIGGFTNLASLKTVKARFEFLKDRIEKIDKALERHFRREFTTDMLDLIRRAKPRKGAPGEKPIGKIGAEGHSLFNAVESAMTMDAAAVAGEIAKLDTIINSGTLTPEQEALAQRQQQLVQLVGDWKNADAARMSAAVEAAEDTLLKGLAAWTAEIEARRAKREMMRGSLMLDTGKLGTPAERQAEAKKALGDAGKTLDVFRSLSSFEQVLHDAFGKDSKIAEQLVDTERAAAYAYEDEGQAIADGVEAFFKKLTKGDALEAQKLRYRLAQPTIDTKGSWGTLSEMSAIQALLMWRQEDGQRHMTAFAIDQAWIDDVQAQMTPEGLATLQFVSDQYANEWQELNSLYKKRHGVNLPRHDNYAPLTVKPAQAAAGQMVNPVTGTPTSGNAMTPGSLRSRSSIATAEPRLDDALQVMIAHKRQMAHWKAYYDFAVDAHAVLGNNNLMNSVEAKAGAQSKTLLAKWIDYFAQGGSRDAAQGLAATETLRSISGRFARMALVGRASTLMIQSTQLAAAAAEMPAGAYAKRFAKLMSGQLGWRAAVKSDFMQRRYRQAPPIVRQALDGLDSDKPNIVKHAAHRLGTLISGADALFTGGTYAIVLDWQRGIAKDGGLTGTEAEAAAHKAAERITERVAQPTRAATRSLFENTATHPMAKLGWAFASEARQKLVLAAWAGKEIGKNPARAARVAFVVWGIGGLMATVLRNAWRDLKDDDDDEVFDDRIWGWKRLTTQTLAGPLQGLPLLGDAIELAIGKAFGQYVPNSGPLDSLAQSVPAVKHLATLSFLDDENEVQAVLKDAEALMTALGLYNETAASSVAFLHIARDVAALADAAVTTKEEAENQAAAADRRLLDKAAKANPKPEKPEAQKTAEKAKRRAREAARAQGIRDSGGVE